MRRTLRHMPAAAGFLALAVVWSYPLILHLSTDLPGPWLGDNSQALWNFWWMRTALAAGADFLHTPYRFAPVGDNLTLYTHAAFPSMIGATILKSLSIVTALNVTTIASLALNGFCAYLLAWHITRDRGGAMVAGIIFGSSPYVAAHLYGHFDLVAAWTIPLFALTVLRAAGGSFVWAIVSGVVLAATAYTAYYYVVFQIALSACLVIFGRWEWSVNWRERPPYARWISIVVVAALALDLVALVAIAVTGGFDLRLGPIRILMREAFNPLQFFWVLLAGAMWLHYRPRVRVRRCPGWSWARAGLVCASMLAVFALLALPLIWNGATLLLSGEYVTHKYVWRNAPVGIDIATMVLGNPFHGLWGPLVQHWYARLGIDLIESGAWLGLVPLVLAIWAVRNRWSDLWIRRSTIVAGVFFVWALGSHVHAWGWNVGLITPAALLRYLPVVSNARMPGRAMVVVYLAMALLCAIAVAWRRTTWRRPALITVVIAALISAESLFAPLPLSAVDCPRIYQVLHDRPEVGSLAELPLSLGDGFGPVTPIDPHFLMCQPVHERPVVGGMTSRLSPGVLARYKADPLIAGWLHLSGMRPEPGERASLPDSRLAAELLEADGIRFVILNRRLASPELRDYVEHVLPLSLVAQDGERALYVVAVRPGV